MDPLDASTFDPEKTRQPLGLVPENLFGSFGKYTIIEKVGQGGMGAVYRAEDSQLGRQVAIKVPTFEFADKAVVLGRFTAEARSVAGLRHRYICPVFEFGEFQGLPYIVAPFIHGQTLHEHIERDRRWPLDRSVQLAMKIAEGLIDAHQQKVVHRDIKPSNIMIESSGEPLILDFGLARCPDSLSKQWTSAGEAIGTPSYMPPEQVDPKLGAMGPACDIYSLAVVLYRLVLGRVPFEGDPLFVIPQILADPPPMPSHIDPSLPNVPSFDAIMRRALAKRPAERFPSMDEFRMAMEHFLQSLEWSWSSRPRLPELLITGSNQRYRPSKYQTRIRIGRQRNNPSNPVEVVNDLVIRCDGNDAKSLRISRQHLEILWHSDQYGLIDRSQAGVSINGRAVRRGEFEPISIGDILSVAGVIELKVLSPNQSLAEPLQVQVNQEGQFEATMGDLISENRP